MRIALDAKRYFFNRTGLGNYARQWVRILQQAIPQAEIHLMTPRHPETEPADARLHIQSPARSFLYREWLMAAHLERIKADIYHGLSNELPFSSGRLSLRKIVTVHDVIFRIYPDFYPATDRFIYHTKTRFACGHADTVVATSHTTAGDLVAHYKLDPARIVVAYQGADPAFYALNPENPHPYDGQPFFLFTGTFAGRKNHALLIEALERIHKQIPHLLVLAGTKGEQLDICRRMAESLGVAHRIRWEVNVPRERLLNLYQYSDGFLFPPLYEGFGIPLIEAMAAGIPIAAHDIPIFREIAGDAAVYFRNERDEAASAMLALIDNSFNFRLLQAAKERLPLFSDEAQAAVMHQLYMS
jgi:glycosyltransferase involved in cell wall biosynthesis